jgi:hypothetical protein
MENRKIKVLAIDDNPDNLITIKALIQEAFSDAFVTTTLTGKKGLELAATEDPDVILLDIVMPKMDGFEVCKKLKADEKLSNIPVVFVTAIKVDKESRIKALECGAEAFLTKPIDESELTAQIRAMAKIKTANIDKYTEKECLAALVNEQTRELKVAHQATLNLLEDLRKENEVRLKSEEKYRMFIDLASDAFFQGDNVGNFIEANNSAVELTGFSRDELLRMNMKELFSNDDFNKSIPLRYDLLDKGDTLKNERKLICKDSRTVFIEMNSKKMTDGTYQSFIRDITDRKRTEEKLRNVARLYAFQSEINRSIVRIREREELFRTICQVAIKFGQFRMAWIGLFDKTNNTVKPFTHDGFEEKYLNLVNIKTDDSELSNGPTGLAFKSGKIVICNDIDTESHMLPWREEALKRGYRSSVAVPFVSKGKLVGILNLYASEVGFFTEDERLLLKKIGENISFAIDAMDSEKERKDAELLLRVINEELIHTNEELVIAKEHAEESDRLKSAFLANMSHEIRTPMNGILGFAGLLKEPKLTGEEQKEYIAIIEKSGARMLNIINDIITISKVESGQMNILVSETNVNEQIEFIYTFFKPEAEKKGLQLHFKNSLTSKEALIKTDKEKIYSILTNLVKNAIKYSDNGAVEIGYNLVETQDLASQKQQLEDKQADSHPGAPVETQNLASLQSRQLKFYVKDTGIGIPVDRQAAVFDRFVQADIGDKRAFQGAGLGLSISKAYVEMLGGRIWLESEEGKGSTFYFTIPYNGEHNAKKVIETTVKDDAAKIQTKSLKILVAEDDETSGVLIEIAIRPITKDILKAKTGKEAVEVCRNNPDIDFVLMDIKMPGMDGYEAAKLIREFNNEVVIIAQTAYALIGDREKAIEAGCNDYLPKPFGRSTLTAIIEKHLKKQMV